MKTLRLRIKDKHAKALDAFRRDNDGVFLPGIVCWRRGLFGHGNGLQCLHIKLRDNAHIPRAATAQGGGNARMMR